MDVGFVEEAYFYAVGGGEGDVCEFLDGGFSKRAWKNMMRCYKLIATLAMRFWPDMVA